MTQVKEQDIYLPFQGLRTHPEGIKALWKFAQDNWEAIVRKLPPGLSMLSSVVQIVTGSFCSKESVKEIESFFQDKSTKGFDQGLAQSLDSVRAKANWLERDGQDVRNWLAERGFLKGKL
jgi:aminopeptidase 2